MEHCGNTFGRSFREASFGFFSLIAVTIYSAQATPSSAGIILTNSTLIRADNRTLENQNITVDHCVLTLDGDHAFTSLRVLDGAIVTHSYSADAPLNAFQRIVGEQHTIGSNSPVVLSNTGKRIANLSVTDETGLITYTSFVDFQVVTTGGMVQIVLVPGSTISEGATILVTYDIGTIPGLQLVVANDLQIEAGGMIDVTGRGRVGGLGKGGVSFISGYYTGGGGGYGGYGGASGPAWSSAAGGSCYGSVAAADDLGSGGGDGFGAGGAGGGAVSLVVGGALRVDGRIVANGGDALSPSSGGGSGGSINLSSSNLLGSGSISANGGAGELWDGGGGGGGRIVITAATNQFSGSINAYGGGGGNYGGAGTIMTRFGAKIARVTVDNGGLVGGVTSFVASESGQATDWTIMGNSTLAVGGFASVHDLKILGGSWIVMSNVSPVTMTVNVAGNIVVEKGGGINLDGRGNPARQGTGSGSSITVYTNSKTIYRGAGGSYGGLGGGTTVSSKSYGAFTSPSSVGSGGWANSTTTQGSAGGGALKLSVVGRVQNDGQITANGGAGVGSGDGGGSGGSIWVSADSIAGAGVISANGGPGKTPDGGSGGGGGRIAITCRSNMFVGVVSAYGGQGFVGGGAGTIYYGDNANGARLVIDNGGSRADSLTPVNYGSTFDLVLCGGGKAAFGAVQFGNLLISSNSWATVLEGYSTVSVGRNATIEKGGGFTLDGCGSKIGQGTGAGRTQVGTLGYYGSGGGYGGNGGGAAGGVVGGAGYGSLAQPTQLGSGGGYGYGQGTDSSGDQSAGGGAVKLTVSGILVVDGTISANGVGGARGGGGGSGGGIWLTAGQFLGAGLIRAEGGDGDLPYAGGGGGGRIAVQCNVTNGFRGSISVRGGTGAFAGGSGTIYMTDPKVLLPRLILDNGGLAGAPTLISPQGNVNLTIGSGSAGAISSSLTVQNLVIAPNAILVCSNSGSQAATLNVNGDLTIQPGAWLTLDGLGYPAGAGNGAGKSVNVAGSIAGGGGAHGGNGGAGSSQAAGGVAYDSVSNPLSAGSGGGNTSTTGAAGVGGGALRLSVNGTLRVDGRLSADGTPAWLAGSGGGAGGSLWMSVGTLTGQGVISVDGGAGDVPNGGGGGGGRIAISYNTNTFVGAITAQGGDGSMRGGAGTIYMRDRKSLFGQVLVNNQGKFGAQTPLSSTERFDLCIGGKAEVSLLPQGLALASLFIDSNSRVVPANPGSTVDLTVYGDVSVATNGAISVSGSGYAARSGPGAGHTQSPSLGGGSSGGGYGGVGGAGALGLPGGPSYGSAERPVDPGSGGGAIASFSSASFAAGSQGGGAIHLRVGGNLQLDGKLSADGNDGLVAAAGGGAGGSIWIQTVGFSGAGSITANGGAGEPSRGGGGGGGRIAVYARTNIFLGPVSSVGGAGVSPGAMGSVLITNLPALTVVAQSPTNAVSFYPSEVDISLSLGILPAWLDVADVTVETPSGTIASDNLVLSLSTPETLRIGFPQQMVVGHYQVRLSAGIRDIFGDVFDSPYVGSFDVVNPVISGTVRYADGTPVVNATVMGPTPVSTDSNGVYRLVVDPSWYGNVTPSVAAGVCVPSSRAYNGMTQSLDSQDYICLKPESLNVSSELSNGQINLHWFGVGGLSYQAYYSTNLVSWLPCGDIVTGTNGPMMQPIPVGSDSQMFFQFRVW